MWVCSCRIIYTVDHGGYVVLPLQTCTAWFFHLWCVILVFCIDLTNVWNSVLGSLHNYHNCVMGVCVCMVCTCDGCMCTCDGCMCMHVCVQAQGLHPKDATLGPPPNYIIIITLLEPSHQLHDCIVPPPPQR